MRHRVAGKRLGRTTSHRTALRRNMAASLIEHGAIRTTEAKAKELRRFVERLITIAKKGTLHARRRAASILQTRHVSMAQQDSVAFDKLKKRGWDDHETYPWKGTRTRGKTVLDVLFDEIAPRYAERPGGYTRIIRLAERRIGDAGKQVIIQLVEEASDSASSGAGRRAKRAAKRHDAAEKAVLTEAPVADIAEEAPVTEEAPVETPVEDAAEEPKAD